MEHFGQKYLSYLRDCVRMVNRDSPVDFLGRSTRGDIKDLSPGDLRQLETSQSIVTEDAEIAKWRKELLLSVEGECNLCFGFYIVTGKLGTTKICCPLLIADIQVSSTEQNEVRLDLKADSIRLYTPLLSLLLPDSPDSDPELLSAEIEKHVPLVPVAFPFGDQIEKLLKGIRGSLPADKRSLLTKPPSLLTDSPFKITVTTVKELQQARETADLTLHPTVAYLKLDALPDFTVEREISEIIKRDDSKQTAMRLIVRELTREKSAEILEREDASESVNGADVLEVLTLSERQRDAISYAKTHNLTVISGPPGTGKSHTIASLAINLAYGGKTVLITSKTREAVSVVVDKLQLLGGKYSVAHVGDKSQKRDFATLIKGVLEYERLDRRTAQSQLLEGQRRLRQIRLYRGDLARSIWHLEAFYGQYHRASAELDKLADVSLPAAIPPRTELDRLRQNKDWVKRALERPIPPFSHRLKSRALLNQMAKSLDIAHPKTPDHLLQVVEKCFNHVLAQEALAKLAQQKNIRSLWSAHADAVKEELESSGDVFNKSRRSAIADLLYGDKDNAPRLRNYANALETPLTTANRARYVSKLLEGVDSSLLLSCFPIWACTSSHLSHALKLQPGLFDYVIIDEASLCDPATAIPALYRAKRAVVVGDEKQLKHRTQLADAKLAVAATKSGIDAVASNDMSYKRSIFEISAGRVAKEQLHMLDEHFRSLPPIISFSNGKWYRDQLKYMRRNPVNEKIQAVHFLHVFGRRNDRDVIPEEYDKALEIVREILTDESSCSIGVVTMTETQANYMRTRFAEDLSLEDISQTNFKCGSPQSFQGDQRHTMIMCLGLDSEAHSQSIAHAFDENRFNVAITRAEDRMYVISSIPLGDYRHILREYYEHIEGRLGSTELGLEVEFESHFEKEVYEVLIAEGLNVSAQYESCGYRIDFVVSQGDAFLAVEVDGPHHFDDKGDYVARDVERALRLTRGGWQIERISCYEWSKGMPARDQFVQRIKQALASRQNV